MKFRLGMAVGLVAGAGAGFWAGTQAGQRGLERARDIATRIEELAGSVVKRPETAEVAAGGSSEVIDLDAGWVAQAGGLDGTAGAGSGEVDDEGETSFPASDPPGHY
jgi:hypothetical protein